MKIGEVAIKINGLVVANLQTLSTHGHGSLGAHFYQDELYDFY